VHFTILCFNTNLEQLLFLFSFPLDSGNGQAEQGSDIEDGVVARRHFGKTEASEVKFG